MRKKFHLLARQGMIRLAEGGDPAGGTDPAPAATPPATPPAPVPTPPATPTPPAAATGAEWDGKVESLPQGAQDLIKQLRNENASERTNAKTKAAEDARTALVQDLGKALGLVTDEGDQPSVEELTEALTKAQTAERDNAVELAVYRTVKDHGGDPAALTDSRAFLAKVAALDPTAEDFTTKVTEAAKAAVTANPSLKAVQGAGQSTVEHPGGPGERTTPSKNLNEAVAKAITLPQ